MHTQDLLSRVDFIISKATISLKRPIASAMGEEYVEQGYYAGFRSSALSFLSSTVGETNIYYKEFDRQVNDSFVSNINAGINILQSLKHDIENGWLIRFKQLVTAEVFSDFLEMSKYLLDEMYKDAAAVMIGSVLEEHLRQLANNHSVDTFIIKSSDVVPKKADLLNADLTKAGVYGLLEQKNVTAWLGLRNSAAHGKYNEYTIEQVKLTYQGVLDFIARIK